MLLVCQKKKSMFHMCEVFEHQVTYQVDLNDRTEYDFLIIYIHIYTQNKQIEMKYLVNLEGLSQCMYSNIIELFNFIIEFWFGR